MLVCTEHDVVLCKVCASEENCALSSESKSAARADGLHVNLAKHMSAVTFKLALSDEEKKVVIWIPLYSSHYFYQPLSFHSFSPT